MKLSQLIPIGRFGNSTSGQIGTLYLVTCTLFSLIGICAALLLQLDMFTPVAQLTNVDWFGKILTGHGMLMVFLVLLPIFPGVFGHLVLPASVGAADLALRGLSFCGWLCHLLGGILVLTALLLGAYDAGWVMMMPVAGFSVPYLILLTGLMLAALAVLFPCLAIARTTLSGKFRRIELSVLPLFSWFLLLGVMVQILITPVRLLTLGGLLGGHVWGWSFFSLADPTGIGHYQRAFWLYAGPATLSLALPVIGLLFEILAARTGRAITRRTLIVSAGFLLMLFGLVSWSQHLISAAESALLVSIGGFLGILMALPASVLLLQLGRLVFLIRQPFAPADLFILVALLSGMFAGFAGMALALPSLAVHLHNTYFTVAHLHLATVGLTGGAILAGLFHFWPMWWRTEIPQRAAKWSARGVLVGLLATFSPMVALGAQGLPRSLHVYPRQFQVLHTVSSVGAIILIAALVLAGIVLTWSVMHRNLDSLSSRHDMTGEFPYTHLPVRELPGVRS